MSDEADTSIKARASEARRKVADASQRGREGAAKVKDTVMPVLDSVVEALGGVSGISHDEPASQSG